MIIDYRIERLCEAQSGASIEPVQSAMVITIALNGDHA
jgi:hypothetical protein